jgi:hypothetical protein
MGKFSSKENGIRPVKRLIKYKHLICSIKNNNRSIKRLLKFDKTHNWHIIDMYFLNDYKRNPAALLEVLYRCSKCNYLKSKCYYNVLYYFNNVNTPIIHYGKIMEDVNGYNCSPCNHMIIENLLK